MNYSYDLRQEAIAEFTDAFVWYEEQKVGLGRIFSTAVYNKLKLICNNPLHYKISYKNHHQALVEKFPFLIVYTVDEKIKHITVMAVFHTSRNPKRKLKR